MGEVLRALLAERVGASAEQWRRSVLHNLRVLTSSDKALLVIWSPHGRLVYGDQVGQELLHSYTTRFADSDRCRRAVREFGLEVWNLRQLWQPGELERSLYYRSFAGPNGLNDTVGVTLLFPHASTELCMAFHRSRPGPISEIERRRELLRLLLEPLRAAFRVDSSAVDPLTNLSSLIDICDQGLALYSLDGRLLKHNPAIIRVLSQDPERDAIEAEIQIVAGSALRMLAPRAGVPPPVVDTRRKVSTCQATYYLRGDPVGWNGLGHATAVLVSLTSITFQIPTPDRLRARYGLTVRELQVASLLAHRFTNVEIARELNISPHTARHHTENVLTKLGVRSRAALRALLAGGPSGTSSER